MFFLNTLTLYLLKLQRKYKKYIIFLVSMINDVAAYHITSYFYIFNQRQYECIIKFHEQFVSGNYDGHSDNNISVYI